MSGKQKLFTNLSDIKLSDIELSDITFCEKDDTTVFVNKTVVCKYLHH